MIIQNEKQYNQEISKYKLLSSTSGVGSIITTKFGTYVLIQDLMNWKFFQEIADDLMKIAKNFPNNGAGFKNHGISKIKGLGIDIIEDYRFIEFLRKEREFNSLTFLIQIPHLELNESYNTVNWMESPIYEILRRGNLNITAEDLRGKEVNYMVPGIHFPTWFKGIDGSFKKIEEWNRLFKSECTRIRNNNRILGNLYVENFAPPRDPNGFIKIDRKSNRIYKTLRQDNLVLICENGHLSDVPWPAYLHWRHTQKTAPSSLDQDSGGNLLSSGESCCANPKLKWTESKTKSEGYSSVFIECENCKKGSGSSSVYPKINLEGINNIHPRCIGSKPWQTSSQIPNEECLDGNGHSLTMSVRLVTASNLYFANTFSSLYIPNKVIANISEKCIEALEIIRLVFSRWKINNGDNPSVFWANKVAIDFAEFTADNGITIPQEISSGDDFINLLKKHFLPSENDFQNEDLHEEYRWQEYKCFSENPIISEDGFRFKEINITEDKIDSFVKILSVEELRLTQIQLDFTRVKPKQRIIRIENGRRLISDSSNGQRTLALENDNIYVLPAHQISGEGIYFQFNDEKIDKWINDNNEILIERYRKIIRPDNHEHSLGANFKNKISLNEYKHFLIHTFSHLMMREFEFSCGYPTASLKERLYISTTEERKMSGVLIYTVEGSEGSMGGLVSQAEPNLIFGIIKKALKRSYQCSSDPLCWESEGQGILDLNLASCFSCSLISETACEEMNLGLDRRALLDEDFGFFKEYI